MYKIRNTPEADLPIGKSLRGKQKFKIIFLGILFSSFTLPANAAPSITSAPNSVADGQSITISGSEFGTGATVYKWDDFENGTNGNPLSIGGWRTATEGRIPVYSSESEHQRVSGEKVAYCDRGGNSFVYDGQNILAEAFVAFWYKRNYIYPICDINYNYNVKWFEVNYNHEGDDDWNVSYYPAARLNEQKSATLTEPPSSMLLIWGATLEGENAADITGRGTLWHEPVEQSKWTRVDFWGRESSAPGGIFNGTPNGFVRAWYISDTRGVERISDGDSTRDNILTNTSGSNRHWRDVVFSFYSRPDDTNPDTICNTQWYDDIYIASSPARIEIGDNINWNSCTHREIQAPTNWSGGSATFTANQGSFQNGSAAYLFVIDENGEASTGHEIIIGGEPDGIAPGIPRGLSVS